MSTKTSLYPLDWNEVKTTWVVSVISRMTILRLQMVWLCAMGSTKDLLFKRMANIIRYCNGTTRQRIQLLLWL